MVVKRRSISLSCVVVVSWYVASLQVRSTKFSETFGLLWQKLLILWVSSAASDDGVDRKAGNVENVENEWDEKKSRRGVRGDL